MDNAVFNICLSIITTAAFPDSQNIITDSHSKIHVLLMLCSKKGYSYSPEPNYNVWIREL
jgi:hypothetical protein